MNNLQCEHFYVAPTSLKATLLHDKNYSDKCIVCAYDIGYQLANSSLLEYSHYCILYENKLVFCSHDSYIHIEIYNKLPSTATSRNNICCICAFKNGYTDFDLLKTNITKTRL